MNSTQGLLEKIKQAKNQLTQLQRLRKIKLCL